MTTVASLQEMFTSAGCPAPNPDTIRGLLLLALAGHGMWPAEANETFRRFESKLPAMNGRWEHAVSNYPKTLVGGLVVFIKQEGRQYLMEVKPKHFAILILQHPPPTDEEISIFMNNEQATLWDHLIEGEEDWFESSTRP